MISAFFIERPILANVIALLLIFLGCIAVKILPVSQYPAIVPPTIQVSTNYPGADADTIIKTVALPIEQQVNGVAGMLYMQSTSTSTGNYNLIVTFAIGTDLNSAQMLVQNRVQAAIAQLPTSVQKQGISVQQKSTAILQFITLTAEKGQYDGLFLDNYATIHMQDELARLPGVGNVAIFGTGTYAMRIWLDPQKMWAYSLNPSEVLQAIQSQNQEISAGQLAALPIHQSQPYQFTVKVPGQLTTPEEFENIIVKTIAIKPHEKAPASNSAKVIRIRDIGRVELGSVSYTQLAKLNNKPTAAIGIYQLPGANALQVAQKVRDTVAKMAKQFPPGLTYSIPFDTTVFVQASVNEVYKTLLEAGILVLIVILFFLQNFRATLVPATTVPVTIIGTFFAILLLNYSINLFTLFALVLAIGIVVDDAIVIVEGVTQYIEKRVSPKDAAIKAMQELLGPILGITLVLMAVFVPAGFMPGLTGAMYAQFALVIAATALISAINAMTLKPTQCALWLQPLASHKKKPTLFLAFDKLYYPLEQAYTRLIEKLVRNSTKVCMLGLALAGIAILGLTKLPTGFIPIEDQGYLILNVQLPDAANLTRTEKVLASLSKEISQIHGVANVITIDGISLLDNNAPLSSAGILYVMFTDWSKRRKQENLASLYKKLNELANNTLEAKVKVLVPPPIQGLGLSDGFQMQVELQDGSFDYKKLQQATDILVKEGNRIPSLQYLMTPFKALVPQIFAPINRLKAETLSIDIREALDTLQTYLGSSYVNLFTKFGKVFQVYVQADAPFRMNIEDIRHFYVRNKAQEMVPLGTLTDVYPTVGPAIISLYNSYPSSSINGSAAAGFSSGQAIQTMEGLAKTLLPSGLGYEWTSTAYQEKIAGNLRFLLFFLSLLLVYMILAGQYESWITPLSILASVPLALLGTVFALGALGLANNMYTQIGILLLIALAAKNAILIVEVAREARIYQKKSIIEAALEGATTRFRPILMTSFAFITGVLPLVFATGAGANARRSIGIAVCSGMIASTCLAVVFVPAFYVFLQTLEEKKLEKKGKPSSLA